MKSKRWKQTKSDLLQNAMVLVLGICLIFSVAGCATSRLSEDDLKWLRETSEPAATDARVNDQDKTDVVDVKKEPLVIRPGNYLTLTSVEDSTLNGRFRVRLDGMVDLPYAKKLSAAGLSVAEFQNKVREAYRSYFKDSDGSITVRISDREILVDVRGLVQKPGRYAIDRDTSLDEVIGKAGGFIAGATRPGFASIRSGQETRYFNLNTYFTTGEGGKLSRWTGGEVITFLNDVGPELSKTTVPTVRVLGEVRSPGEMAFVPGADIYHYFAVAGGPTLYSDQDQVELVRGSDHDRRTILVSMKEFSEHVKIKGGDVIIVHSNQPSSLERRVQISSGLATVISTLIVILVTVF